MNCPNHEDKVLVTFGGAYGSDVLKPTDKHLVCPVNREIFIAGADSAAIATGRYVGER